jgi:hypothetical protein
MRQYVIYQRLQDGVIGLDAPNVPARDLEEWAWIGHTPVFETQEDAERWALAHVTVPPIAQPSPAQSPATTWTGARMMEAARGWARQRWQTETGVWRCGPVTFAVMRTSVKHYISISMERMPSCFACSIETPRSHFLVTIDRGES